MTVGEGGTRAWRGVPWGWGRDVRDVCDNFLVGRGVHGTKQAALDHINGAG